jgi:hypothetical protein
MIAAIATIATGPMSHAMVFHRLCAFGSGARDPTFT